MIGGNPDRPPIRNLEKSTAYRSHTSRLGRRIYQQIRTDLNALDYASAMESGLLQTREVALVEGSSTPETSSQQNS